MFKVSVVIPTKNAGKLFKKVLTGFKTQDYEGDIELIVIDSGSKDFTRNLAESYGTVVIQILPEEFDHGLTRNRAIESATGDVIVLISQDAIPGNEFLIKNLVSALMDDKKIAGVYARQIPHEDADPITKRNLNNWLTGRETRELRWIEDRIAYNKQSPMERYLFCNFDNVCSAIRKDVWKKIPFRYNDFGEDITWAQEVLEGGWKIVYCPEAYVIHSHSRSFKYEYDRNRLCHRKLYQQFGVEMIPTWKHLILSIWRSTLLDWNYLLKREHRMLPLIRLLINTPMLNIASLYGQFVGARSGRIQKQQVSR